VLDHGLSEEGLLTKYLKLKFPKKSHLQFLGLREEAEFYNLPKLIALCNERIAEREKLKRRPEVFY
jgi:hypothetical protein